MSVWILDGVVWHSQLLSFVLTKSNIQDTTVMIVVDISQPWTIMESLERWAEVVRKHIQTLQIPDKQLKAMQENCKWIVLGGVPHLVRTILVVNNNIMVPVWALCLGCF